MIFTIKEKQKLIDFLVNIFGNKKAKEHLKFKNILINGKEINKNDYQLRPDDIVIVRKHNDLIDIIYEDKDIIVINKKEGLLTVATDKSDNTLYRKVSEYVKQNNRNNKIFVVHRLDKDTSGIIMFAKNQNVKEMYQNNWNELVIKRSYIALVEGITLERGTIKSYLKEVNNMVYSTNDPQNKLAITNYKRLRVVNNNSLLEINIDSGRKNQIRVHMKDINHPIIGDTKYGNNKAKRLFLHANSLVIKNPISKKIMTFQIPLPKNFK